MKKILKKLIVLPLISLASMAYAQTLPEMPDKLTIGKLQNFIKTHNLTSVEQVLEALPDRVLKNFVMLHKSRSLAGEITSADQPRVVLFTPDARLMLAFATNLTDRPDLTTQIEFAQLQTGPGRWKFGILDFKNGKMKRSDPDVCADCHGAKDVARPIWESYPDWDSTFAQHEGSNDRQISLKMQQLINNKDQHPRLKHLIWSQPGHYVHQHQRLDDRKHSQASMAFGMEMASGQAQAIYSRIKQHPDYASKKKNIMCGYPDSALRSLGISDFDLQLDAMPGEQKYLRWSTGETGVARLVQLLVLNELTREHPGLKTLLQNTPNIARHPAEQPHVEKALMYDDLRERMRALYLSKGQARQDDREALRMRGRTVIGAGLLFQAQQPVCNYLNNL